MAAHHYSSSSSSVESTYSPAGSYSKARVIDVGYLVLIIKTEQFAEKRYDNPEGYDTRVFGHPALVLETKGDLARVILVTSLGNCQLKDKSAHVRMQHIPIAPAPPHCDTREQIRLMHGTCHKKDSSYVKVHEQFWMPKAILLNNGDPKTKQQLRLTQRSFEYVREAVKKFQWVEKVGRHLAEMPHRTSRPFPGYPEMVVGPVRQGSSPRGSPPYHQPWRQEEWRSHPSPVNSPIPRYQPPAARQRNQDGGRQRVSLGSTSGNSATSSPKAVEVRQ